MSSEPTTPSSPVDPIVMTRIADALERIATVLEHREIGDVETPFPWWDDRISKKIRDKSIWKPSPYADDQSRVRPETFEAFLRIGRSALSHGELRNVGEKTISTLDGVFEDHGFSREWLSS